GKRPTLYWITLTGAVECHSPEGALNWNFPLENPGPRGPLAVGDVDTDGREEIVAGGGIRSVHCLDDAGQVRWRFEGMAPFHSGPVIADLEGDSNVEILAASDDGVLFCLDGRSGEVNWNHRTFTGRIDTTIAVGDVDGDGKREVFYGDGSGHFYALDCLGEERWSFNAGDWIESAPAIGDVDGDGAIDVLAGSGNGSLYCFSVAGRLKWRFDTGKRISASPTLCDSNEDGMADILIPSHNGILYCLSAGGAWDPKRIVWPCKRYDLAQTASAPVE
ncbi:MAG: PQQ-like beta-propeller repeat protein, partial [Candidatus Hydrogenedentes bacterium]|nr:PQQ-like beta-propeller repeat protein [Candidatus Hydrogenedentota bacterium]